MKISNTLKSLLAASSTLALLLISDLSAQARPHDNFKQYSQEQQTPSDTSKPSRSTDNSDLSASDRKFAPSSTNLDSNKLKPESCKHTPIAEPTGGATTQRLQAMEECNKT